MKKTNSNDKEKKRIYLFYCHFNRNNLAVSVLSPRGSDSCHYLTFYNRNYSANSSPLSDVFRLLLSHGLTIITWFCMMAVVLSQRSDGVNPARSMLKFWINHMIDHRHVIFVLAVVKVAKRDVTAVRSMLVGVIKFITNGKYAFFCIYQVRVSPDNITLIHWITMDRSATVIRDYL